MDLRFGKLKDRSLLCSKDIALQIGGPDNYWILRWTQELAKEDEFHRPHMYTKVRVHQEGTKLQIMDDRPVLPGWEMGLWTEEWFTKTRPCRGNRAIWAIDRGATTTTTRDISICLDGRSPLPLCPNRDFTAWLTWRKEEPRPCERVGAANQLLQSVYGRGHKQQITETFANTFTREQLNALMNSKCICRCKDCEPYMHEFDPYFNTVLFTRELHGVEKACHRQPNYVTTYHGTDAESLPAITVCGGVKKQKDIPSIKKVTTNHCIKDFFVWLKPVDHWLLGRGATMVAKHYMRQSKFYGKPTRQDGETALGIELLHTTNHAWSSVSFRTAEEYCCGTQYACGPGNSKRARFVIKCKADVQQHSFGEGTLNSNDGRDRIGAERRHDHLHDNAILEAFTPNNVNALLMTGIVVKFVM
jgi:hypothetical protein